MTLGTRIAAGVLTALLTAGGVAVASQTGILGSSDVGTQVTANDQVYTVGDAGSVSLRVEGSTLVLVDVSTNPGWSATVHSQTAREVEIDFTNGTTRLRFDAELEDGRIKVEVKSRTEVSVPSTSTTSTSTTSTTSTSTTSTTSTSTTLPAGSTETFQVQGAGSVSLRVEGSTLVLVDVSTNPGWSATVDSQTTREVEIDFTNGTTRLRFDAELDDGRIKVEVKSDIEDGDDHERADDENKREERKSEDETSAAGLIELGRRTFQAGAAGSVTVDVTANGLVLVSVDPADGWQAKVSEASSQKIEVEFDSGMQRLEFHLKLDGGLKLEIGD